MGVILKWILIPVVLVACGYFLIGAKIGRVLPGVGGGKAVEVTPVADNNAGSYGAPDVDVQRAQKFASPDISVSAQKPSRRRQRQHPVPTADTTEMPKDDSFSPRSGHINGPG